MPSTDHLDPAPSRDTKRQHTPPTSVDGVRVERRDEELEWGGEIWVTLVPVRTDDRRIWEFSLTTGRLVLTRAQRYG